MYPADWRADANLKKCSAQARGVLIELLLLMHDTEPRGTYLVDKDLPNIIGLSPKTVSACVSELVMNGVLLTLSDGRLASRKMMRDTEKSNKNREAGLMGGNPTLKRTVNPPLKAKKLEARSYSLDTRKKEVENGKSRSPSKGTRIPDDWQPDIDYAKSKGLRPEEIKREAEKFKNYWSARAGSQGVKLDWTATWRNWVLSCAEKLGRKSIADMFQTIEPMAPSPIDWASVMKMYRITSNWRQEHGPQPFSCGCRVPAEYLEEM